MSSHPFRLYLDAAKTVAYTTGVTTTSTYTEIIVDEDVSSFNEIITSSSLYNGEHVITTTSTTDFTYTVALLPERTSYASTTSGVVYDTTSTSAYGDIKKFHPHL